MDGIAKIEELTDEIALLATTYGMSVIGAILTLIIGWIIAGWLHNSMLRWLSRSKRIDATLRPFLASMVKYLVLILTVLAMLDQFGVQTASLIAVLGAAGLAVGLALQGTLSNVAAGVMLLIFRPFKVGDYVDAGGVAGTVKQINLFTTDFDTPDNVRIIVPNSQLWDGAVKNYSYNQTRRVDFVFGIAYEDDIGKAMSLIGDEIGKDDRAHGEPEPFMAVTELADSSVNIVVRVWCDAANYWGLKFDLTRAVKERFDADGITIPYPQRVVHRAGEPDSEAKSEATG
ncbi:MAG: mechanosensitive ion channel [Alphaproteobacteria bacterium]